MKIRRSLLKSTITVRSYAGEGPYGPAYAAAVTVRCNVDASRRLVRNAAGDEVVSEATLHAHPDVADAFPPESLVTINGRNTVVIGAKTHTLRGRPTHVEVTVA